ncbi:MAG TPA: hypothetical protein VHO06_26685 [Polyangia bacterium]|nr:hypothetical protein [Polyangia bacterium]
MADGFYVPGDTGVHFEVTDGSTFDFDTGVPGIPILSTGTFDTTSAPGSGAVYLVNNVPGYVLCAANACADAQGNGPIPAQGSCMLTISSAGPSASASGDTTWPTPHGTLTVTMPAEPGGAESGTIVVDATF